MYVSNFLSSFVSVEFFYLHNNRHQTLEDSSSRRSIPLLDIRNPYRKLWNGCIFLGWVCTSRTFHQHHVYRHNIVHLGNLYYHRKFHRVQVLAYNNLIHQNCKDHHQHSTIPLCMGCGPFYRDCLHIHSHEEDNLLKR